MVSAIIDFSIRNKLLVGLMLAGLVAWGVFSATSLPLDAIPDVTNNQVQIITQSPALAAQEVEQLLTVPLELQLRTIPGVNEIRSISRFGLSVITVVFDDDVDTYHTRQLVAEKLKRPSLTWAKVWARRAWLPSPRVWARFISTPSV